MSRKNIYLIGMMGSGKTVTARALADMLGYDFTDLDSLIEDENKTPIASMFRNAGESFFRDVEAETLMRIHETPGQVISTGGGIVLRGENVDAMKRTGRVVYLRTAEETLYQRVQGNVNRPLLDRPDWKEELKRILDKRAGLYEAACDMTVDTDGRTAETVAGMIHERLEAES